MFPQSMKKPVWLIPFCILSMTGGIFFMLVYFFPEFAPKSAREHVSKRAAHSSPLGGRHMHFRAGIRPLVSFDT